MSAQKRGLAYEHEIANSLTDTYKHLRVVRSGYSGNSAIDQPDIVIISDVVWALELKKSTKDRFYIQKEDIEQLLRFGNKNIKLAIAVKFSYREPVVIDLSERFVDGQVRNVEDYDEPADFLAAACHPAFKPHVTKAGSLRLDKPDTDSWVSSKAGREDHVCIARKLRITK